MDRPFRRSAGACTASARSTNGKPPSRLQWVWFGIMLSAVTYLLLRNLLLGRLGRALLSLQADEIASASVGVRVYRAKVMAFVVAALTCGIAGALVAQQTQYINADFINFNLSIFILLLVLFGGAVRCTVRIGAALLTPARCLPGQLASAQHFSTASAPVRALCDARRPGGLFEKLLKRRAPLRPSEAHPAADLPSVVPGPASCSPSIAWANRSAVSSRPRTCPSSFSVAMCTP